MNSIQLKTKELKVKCIWLRLIDSESLTHWTHKSGQLIKLVFGAKFHMCFNGSIHVMNGMSALERLYCVAIECLK